LPVALKYGYFVAEGRKEFAKHTIRFIQSVPFSRVLSGKRWGIIRMLNENINACIQILV